nr:hypothetical protein BaRGS_013376 [Batillaria attramentaria]
MEALKIKYEQNRAEVLAGLEVSKELLEVMTRHGLIDIADCVKYQGISDTKKRNGSLMKTMVERRTERAYPLFIQSLRQAGQDSVANLLTDIGEETRILTHLQSELEHEIGAIDDYIQQEERRTGMAPPGDKDCEHERPAVSAAPTTDREVWVGVQATLKRATAQFERCRAVIDKLHKDCQDLATANGEMVVQIRNCYSRGTDIPKNTQAMFQSLIDDVERLMNRKSKALQQESEGRTNAMRLLRHLRDWIESRRLPTPNCLRSRSRATPDEGGGGPYGELQDHSELPEHVEPHAISTVLEGLHLLEQQVREYVHMEILLTDKYRSELRYRHLRKKSQGYTPRGLDDARRTLDRLESAPPPFTNSTPNNTLTSRDPGGTGLVDKAQVARLRSTLDAICEEYNACVAYMNRATNSLSRLVDLDGFLAQTEDSHQGHKKRKTEKDKKGRHLESDAADKGGSVFGFFKKKADTKPSSKHPEINLPVILPPVKNHHHHQGKSRDGRSGGGGDLHDESLLSQLKLLVANFEVVKMRLNSLEDKYRREYDHKRRSFEAKLQQKEEEIAQLQIRFKEAEAEKDKYRTLYDKVKISYTKKR